MPRRVHEPSMPPSMQRVRGEKLRTGWTTGICAAAAAKAATKALLEGKSQAEVDVKLPRKGEEVRVRFPVERCEVGEGGAWAEAVVVKDAGDDPDVTDGAHLTVRVAWREEPGLELGRGEGVGVVTKPGLGLEVGGPAINAVPRRMISYSVKEVLDPKKRGVRVAVSVPGGEEMASKTTNPRLGVVGGISILGTTGIVRPFSTASWRASVGQAINVMGAQGHGTLVLSTGGLTEKAAMRLLPGLDEVCFVEVGDFTGYALKQAVRNKLKRVFFVGMAGKISKLAAGIMMTHWTRSKVDNELLAEVTQRAGGSPELVEEMKDANTARHAYELWREAKLEKAPHLLCTLAAENLSEYVEGEIGVRVVMVDFDTLDPAGASPGALEEDHLDGRMNRLLVIGLDGTPPGAEVKNLVDEARLVVGGDRHLDALGVEPGRAAPLKGDLSGALEKLEREKGPGVVLASGDPGFFGITRVLSERFGDENLRVIPGVSSVALAFARAGLAWDDAKVVSAHGREPRRAVNVCRAHHKVAVLTSPDFGPGDLAGELRGLDRTFVVAERLGETGERVFRGDAAAVAAEDWEDPNVVLVLDEGRKVGTKGWIQGGDRPGGWALPEDAFEHRSGMVTKSEVRALILARLGPKPGDLVWDVGAGSGSVAVECARLGGAAVAVERDPESRARIKANAARHDAYVQVVEGEAPEALEGLPEPDAVFVGGTGEGFEEILGLCATRARRAVVLSLATLERVVPAGKLLEERGFEVETVMLQASRMRGVGGLNRLAAGNPVFVVSGVRP